MTTKEPVLLTVLIETARRRWFAAGLTLDGRPVPLICSAAGNLAPYVGVAMDEQVNFLRHRLCGVLQRGCDRLWGRQMKPRQIAFVADADFDAARPELTQQVAEHFVVWMTKPPVAFFTSENGFREEAPARLCHVAGDMQPSDQEILAMGLPPLVTAMEDSDLWELAPTKPSS